MKDLRISEDITIAAGQSMREGKYWLNKFSGELVKSSFPYDYDRVKKEDREPGPGSVEFEISGELFSRLMSVCKGSDYTLYMILAAVLVLLLYNHTNNTDIVIGSPIDKQDQEGDFINTVLALRNQIRKGMTFKDLLLQVRQTIIEAAEHQNYPIETLLFDLDLEYSEDEFPLFDVVILLENIQDKTYIQHIRSRVTFSFLRSNENVTGNISYNSLLYDKETIRRIANHFVTLMENTLFSIDVPVSDVDVMSEEEKNQVLFEFNNTHRQHPRDKTIQQLFEEQVARTPDCIAVGYTMDLGDIYEELDAEEIDASQLEKLEPACFRTNPFIFTSQLNQFDETNPFKLLKTHRHDIVVVNENVVRLLKLFNGQGNLASIYSSLKGSGLKFLLYSIKIDDVLEISYKFDRKEEISLNHEFADFVRLVKSLYKNNLIELVDVNPNKTNLKIPISEIFDAHDTLADTVKLDDLFKYKKDLPAADVLLLGDTPGQSTSGLLYMASYLRKHHIKAYALFNHSSWHSRLLKEQLEELLTIVKPKVVGVSMKWFLHIARVLEICKIVKEYAREHSRNITIVVGGNSASFFWENIIENNCIDYLIRGDGEVPLLKICQGADPTDIPNLVYRNKGKIVANPITYVQTPANSSEIYLSHMDEILLSDYACVFGIFFIFTQKGCRKNCHYCGGCNNAQRRSFNRPGLFRRNVSEVRKDLMESQKYSSTIYFLFDEYSNEKLLDYCKEIWEGIDLSNHFGFLSNVIPPSPELIEYGNKVFKYVYWNLDMASMSERHRKQLFAENMVKYQPTDKEVLDMFDECEKYNNNEILINIITGLPYFNQEDIKNSERIEAHIMDTYSCFGEFFWARLHAEPGAPVAANADKYNMDSLAHTFEDFFEISKRNFYENDIYPNVDNYDYPFIYFKTEGLNSKVSKYYSGTSIKSIRYREEQKRKLNIYYKELSYHTLNKKVNQIARLLRKKGVTTNTTVGILIERSIEMIAGLLGILKAGGLYVPLDPQHPGERLKYMLQDCGINILLTQQSLLDKIAFKGESIDLGKEELYQKENDSDVEYISQPSDLAYMIFTSGSAGNPKGVMIQHQSIVNTLSWRKNYYRFNSSDTILQVPGYFFDSSVEDIFTPLISGARLILIPLQKLLDVKFLEVIIKTNKITHFLITPALYKIFLREIYKSLTGLKSVTVAGEQFTEELVADHFQKLESVELYNEYGPTENSVCSTVYRFKPGSTRVLIGKPVDNANCYILNENRKPNPVGVPGELCVSGPGLAIGYQNNPELTGEKFVPHPFLPGELLYRTGDLARWLPTGDIEFLGRIDYQVKIRGVRIELEEIEAQLLKHKDIKDVVVITRDDEKGEQHLCAYLVSTSDTDIEATALRQYLSQKLPFYMVPSIFTKIDKIPVTPNGKVDRKALPQPGTRGGAKYIPPRNRTESRLAKLWAKELGQEIETIGIDSNFFELGGDSLKATMLVGKLYKEFKVQIPLIDLFKVPTVAGLAKVITGLAPEIEEFPGINLAEKKNYYVLSSAQKRLYVLQQFKPGNTSYNLPLVLSLKGDIDIDKLENTFKKLISRHESLRTSFKMVNEEAVQQVHDEVEFQVQFHDLTTANSKGTGGFAPLLTEPAQHHAPRAMRCASTIKDFIRPFDLARAPLIRVELIKSKEKEYILMLDMHHIITDGISHHNILTKEFLQLFAGDDLPPVKLQYKDYAGWEYTRAKKGEFQEQEEYWLREFAGDIPILELPTDFPRPVFQDFAGNIIDFEISKKETKALNELANNQGATSFMVILALVNIFLSKLSGQEDIVIGTPTAGRYHPDLQQTLGMFVNTLALRNYPSREKTFTALLNQVKEKTIAAFENQDYQFESLVEKLAVPRDTSRNPIFDVMLTSHDFVQESETGKVSGEEVVEEGIKAEPYPFGDNASKFDLSLRTFENKEKLHFSLEYCTKLFKEETIERFVQYFKQVISSAAAFPGKKVSEIEIMTEEEKNRVLVDFNGASPGYPEGKTIHQLFADQAELTPDNIAVIGPLQRKNRTYMTYTTYITYRELNEKSHRLAYLLKEKGIESDTIAAIKAERSIETILGIFGILKAGGAYLPIDPGYPEDRLTHILNDSNARIVLNFEQLHLESVSNFECPAPGLNSSDLAYVITTSGSTGVPKGVMIEHRSLVNLAARLKEKVYHYKNPINAALVSPYVFDASIKQIFPALLLGHTLVIIPEEARWDMEKLLAIYKEKDIRVSDGTPAHLRLMLEYKHLLSKDFPVEQFLIGGEELETTLCRQFIAAVNKEEFKVINVYGPTECCDVTTTYTVTRDNADKHHRLPIGSPLGNINVYVLGPARELQPIGVPGELCIAGLGVGRGYLNRPELTAEKFIEHMSYGSYRSYFYQTGDLARWLGDGNIEFLGRIDRQVKIRGFRIEPAEIENQLLDHEKIIDAVVLAKENQTGDKSLCAYIVLNGEISLAELRAYLSTRLPDYMIPAYFVKLETIPLTSGGKVDRQSLPEPEGTAFADHTQYSAPRNEIEKTLAETWENVLARKKVGINENFFMIGGDSIKALQITARMTKAGYRLDMRNFFQNPMISSLALHVKKSDRIIDQTPIRGIIPLTPIQARFFSSGKVNPHHYNQAVMFYSEEGLEEETIKAIFVKLQEHHDALRMVYKRNIETGQIVQTNHDPDYPLSLQVYDLRNPENNSAAFETITNEIQASINLETGPLMKLALFHEDDGDQLLIVIHHLVIDAVSWRILLEDIETLYRQYKKGESLELPLKTDSFKTWSEKLSEYADSKSFLKEKSYWAALESITLPKIKTDFQGETNRVEDTKTLSFSLSEPETNLLLTKVNNAFTTEINEILLTALGLGIKKTFGQHRVLLALEGHGREDVLENIDISRTVGWFTSIYPVLLDISYTHDPGRQIKEVKETLRKIPGKGIGYGILRYLTTGKHKKELEFQLTPQISFNYLGQVDADVQELSFKIAPGSVGHLQDIDEQQGCELEISGIITNNRLTMTAAFSEKQYKPGTIQSLLDHFQFELSHIIAFCSSKEKREFTPGDFTYKGLAVARIDEIVSRYPLIEDLYTLTPMQEGMLFHALYDRSSSAYFEQISYRLQGELNPVLVEKSLNQLMKRHDILRTVFVGDDLERPIQIVLRNRVIDFHYQDISKIGGDEDKEDFIKEFKEKDKQHAFDLSKDVLMRVTIFQVDEARYEFTWSFHHILMDGWCIGILNSEFFEIYTGYLENRPPQLPTVKPYRTYIQWLEKQDREVSKKYWKNYLASYEEQTAIPKIKKKDEPGYRNEQVSFAFDLEKTSQLNELAARNRVTLNTVTQAVWGIILGKYNGKADVVFGAVVSGRPFELEGVEAMVGLFINTIPVRIRFKEKTKFNTLLQNAQQDAIAGEPYHYHPLAEIQSESPLKQNLIDHLFIFENYPTAAHIEGYEDKNNDNNRDQELPLTLSNLEVFEQTNYDFNAAVVPGKQLLLRFAYNGNIYHRDLVERIAGHFTRVLDQVIDNEAIEIENITLLSAEEKNRVLYDFNRTDAGYPIDKTIHELFARQVEQTLDHIAVVGALQIKNRTYMTYITYRELHEKSNQLAHLLQDKGVRSDTIVGIMMERSIEMIIGILGILKAGGAYLPIDPGYPENRIKYMLADSNAKILLTYRDINFNSHHSSFIIHHSCSLAYVIYTSGTTGKPKGVMIEHRSLVNRLNWMQKKYPLEKNDTILQKTPFTFDVSVWELLWWAMKGAKVCLLVPGGEKDPGAIIDAIEKHKVTIMHFVPSMLSTFLDYLPGNIDVKRLSALKQVIASGEVLTSSHVERFNEILSRKNATKLANLYGPTEAAIDVSYYDCPGSGKVETIPIGKPIDNIRLYILDGNGQHLQPVGIAGELCIGGIGLARGYLNQPQLTAEKFDHDLLDYQDYCDRNHRSYRSYRSYIYHTGDLARWLPDGNIEFLGRSDHQVKIRGARIELGEIERQLLNHSKIKAAVVTAKEDETRDKYLCAYIITNQEISITELKKYLSDYLPDYMIPAFIVELEKFPLTASGKIHRGALPEPGEINLSDTIQYCAPRNKIERKLVETWENVLARKKIGINENFFMIGGDSIKSIRIMSAMKKEGYHIEMKDFFKNPFIADLALKVKKTGRVPDQGFITGTIPLLPNQQEFFTLVKINPHQVNQAVMLYSKEGFDEGAIQAVFKKIQRHHDGLRITYKKENQEILQINHGADYPLSFHAYYLKNRKAEEAVKELEAKINEIRTGIDLEKGPLMKLSLFHLEDGDCLLIVIHRLVIDDISWRILLEDVETLYQQYKRGEEFKLPLKSDSYKLWSETLSTHANSSLFQKEKEYWKQLGSMAIPPIEKDFETANNHVKDEKTLSFELSEEETNLLLTGANEAFGTETDDIVLTALGSVIKNTFGCNRLLTMLETAGREGVPGGVQISRTVGWFTRKFPVVLDFSYANDPARQIKEIKETLRQVPNKGIGYGLLKYLTRQENKKEIDFNLNPQIRYNYLGQQQWDTEASPTSFEITKEFIANMHSKTGQREYELDVSGKVTNNRLTITIAFNKNHFKAGTIAALLTGFQSQLSQLIGLCVSGKTREFTPSDFTYKGLPIDTLDSLVSHYQVEDLYTLTPMQQGMLFHSLYDNSPAYFEQVSYRLRGELDVALVEKSLQELAKRYDILRTTFVYEDLERPIQVVLKNRKIDFYYEDIRKISGPGSSGNSDGQEIFIKEFKEKDKQRGFDPGKDALMRVTILRTANREFELVWSFHHILIDGWCIGILNAEFFRVYNCYKDNRPVQLPPVKPYRTYINWLEKQDKDASQSYWKKYLDSYDQLTGVPQINDSKNKSDEQGYKNEKVSFLLDVEKTQRLNKLAGKNYVTLNIVMQTIWGVMLSKYNGKDDVVFGAVVSGRPAEIEGIESMIGLFINTVPVRIKFEGSTQFNDLVQRVQESAIASEPHHYSPLAEIQSGSILKQNLLNHILIFENFPIAAHIIESGDETNENKRNKEIQLTFSNVEVFEQTNYDLNILIYPGDQLSVIFSYNGNIYSKAFVVRMGRHFNCVIDQVIDNEAKEIKRLTLLAEKEKSLVLNEFNKTGTGYPTGKTVHELFEERAIKRPDNIALVGKVLTGEVEAERIETEASIGIASLSYKQLNERSNQLAHLLQEKGIKPGSVVGIVLDRSPEMLAAILGVMKAGAAYLPLDPVYPQERINFILEDSGADIILIGKYLKHLLNPDFPKIEIESSGPGMNLGVNPVFTRHYRTGPSPTDLVYVIYTSGSTGRPKGVMIEHRPLVNFIKGITDVIDFKESDAILSLTTISFDIFGLEAILPLTRGSKVVMGTVEEQMNAEAAGTAISQEGVTILQVTPSRLSMLIANETSAGALKSLHYLLVGGEAFPAPLLESTRQIVQGKIFNLYGPTETTIWSTVKEVSPGKSLNIGKPIANTRIYILDRVGNLSPIGVPGELYIAGDGLARGYLNQPELTAEKFIEYRSYRSYKSYIYRTGDLARWLTDGNIEFSGRTDHQVKIRGFRIELGEIETQLTNHSSIKEAVVMSMEEKNREKYLCAYIVPVNEITIGELREFLLKRLPGYMVPSSFVQIEEIPMTPNGKIDRKALGALGENISTGVEYTAPTNEKEKIIAQIWQEVLKLEKVGVHDNFFDLGGNSLHLITVNSKLKKAIKKDISMVKMFRYPTVHTFSQYLNQEDRGTGATAAADEKIEESVNVMEDAIRYLIGEEDE